MSAEQIIPLVIGLIVIAAVAVTVAFATSMATRGDLPRLGGQRSAGDGRDADGPTADGERTGALARGSTTFISPASTRQVARVVALLFLAAVAVVVALTRAWPEQESAIFTLLAGGVLLVVLFMDMIPASAFGRYRRPLEGIGAIVFLGLLMAFSGGAASPFLVGFYLVTAGTALSAEGRAPLAVALFGAVTIAVVGLLDAAFGGPIEPDALAWIGINAVSLILLADIATAAARSQRHARDEALRASRFDALTGLYNRSFFFTTMEQEIRRSDRMGRGFTMLMLDLDDLKPVNDTFGHQWGDRLLKAIADTIRRTIRFTDAAARYGGDEFVILLPETDATGGYVVGEKLRRDIYALTLHAADRNVRSSVSIGIVAYPDDGNTIEQLVAAADVAMYEAKRRGKNRIVGYQTRTERVATDIDGGPGDLVQLAPAEDVRTGGDPAPWGPTAAGGRVPVFRDGGEAYGAGAGRGSSERRSIPVEPEESPGPWSAPTPVPAADRRRAGGLTEQPAASEPAAPDRPGTDAAAQPWLTRTESSPDIASEPHRAEPEPPPAPRGSTGQRASEEGLSRTEEISRGGDRPWIALPIEPDEPPDSRRG